MRDTKYAKELATGKIVYSGGEEARIERLYVKSYGEEEIRFSWWKNSRMAPRPLDISENDLLRLVNEGIQNNVFSNDFLTRLKKLLPE